MKAFRPFYILFLGIVMALWLQPASPAAAAVTLIRFEAAWQPDGSILVTWETATEPDTIGFFLHRAGSEDGDYVEITDLDNRGTAVSGDVYTFVDTNVTPGNEYWYKLEDLEADQSSLFHGPVQALDPNAATPSPSPTPTQAPSATPTPTKAPTPTATPTPSPTASPTLSVASPTATPSRTPTATITATSPPNLTPTITATPSPSPTLTPTATLSPTPLPSPTSTPFSPTPTSPLPTATPVPPTFTPVPPTPTSTPSATPVVIAASTPTAPPVVSAAPSQPPPTPLTFPAPTPAPTSSEPPLRSILLGVGVISLFAALLVSVIAWLWWRRGDV